LPVHASPAGRVHVLRRGPVRRPGPFASLPRQNLSIPPGPLPEVLTTGTTREVGGGLHGFAKRMLRRPGARWPSHVRITSHRAQRRCTRDGLSDSMFDRVREEYVTHGG